MIGAFALYFGLVNLAEARGRVRGLRRRERAARDGVLDDSVADAIAAPAPARADRRRARRADRPPRRLAGPDRPPDRGAPPDRRSSPCGRCAGAPRAARRSAPDPVARTARSGAVCARRSRSCGGPRTCASSRPTPLDEVRTAMAFFDATLFTVVPRLYRALDAALDPPSGRAPGRRPPTSGRTGTRPPRVAAVPALGQLDRRRPRRQPGVTAEITERTLRIHADHVLRGYEAVATRLMQTVAAATSPDRVAAAARLAPRPRRRGPARDRSAAPPALPGRAVPPALRVHRRAAAPDAGRADRRAGAADRAVRRRRPSSTPSSPRSRRRSSPTASSGSPGARSPSCAGSSGRSGSTWPRSRSASTPAVHAGRARGDPSRAAAGTTELSRRGDASDEVLATFRAIAAAQARFGVEACHRYVVSFTAVGRRTSPTSSSWLGRHRRGRRTTTEPQPADPRRRPAVRVERGARCGGADPGRAARRPRLPRGHRRPRRSPGGDARLLGLEQGIGLPGRGLDAPPGAGGAGRGGPVARRRADALPRPRRRASAAAAGRPTGRSSGQAPGLGRRAAEADRAGRGDRRQLLGPDHRPAPPRAGDRRGPAGVDARARRAARARARGRRRRSWTSWPRRRGPPTARSSTTIPGSPRSSATSRRSASCPTCGSARGRRRAAGATSRRRSIRCGRSPGPSPGRRPGSTCPAGTASGTALEAYREAHGEAGLDAIARLARDWPFLSSLLDNAEMSLAKADMGVARLYAGAGAPAPGDDRRWATIETEYRRTVVAARAGHRPRAAARRVAGPPALGRAAQPVRRLALRAPGPAAGPAAGARARRPRARSRAAARPADRQRGRGRAPEHRLSVDHARSRRRCCDGGRGRRAPATWADIGAGDGAFTLALADLLGPGGADRGRRPRRRRPARRTPRPMAARFPATTLRDPRRATSPGRWTCPPLDGLVAANSLHFVPRGRQVDVIRGLAAHLRPGGAFVVVEYDADRGNPWVPHPFSAASWERLAADAGLVEPRARARPEPVPRARSTRRRSRT